MSVFLYRLVTNFFKPLIYVVLLRRRSKGKEISDKKRFAERRGIPSIKRKKGRYICFIAPSVGETLSLIPLIEGVAKKDKDINILIATTTTASLKIFKDKKLPEKVIHQFAPVDVNKWTKRFLNYWQPEAIFTVDSDIWPNMVLNAEKRNIPVSVLNGRMSDKSFKFWNKNSSFAKRIFSCIKNVFAYDIENAEKFAKLGVENSVDYDNLKYSYTPKIPAKISVEKLQKEIGNRKFYLVSSTHKTEEEKVLQAHKKILSKNKNALLILIPRHPNRTNEIQKIIKDAGLELATRTDGEKISKTTQVYLANTFGEMELFYSVSSIVFMAGSLINWGGHNPIEPAYFNNTILTGKYIKNFTRVFSEMIADDACIMVKNTTEMSQQILKLMDDKSLQKKHSQNAKQFVNKKSKVKDKYIKAVLNIINTK